MNKKHKIWQSHIPGCALGANVVSTKTKDANGKLIIKSDIGFALRFWKRALKDAGTLQELKERTHYRKKSDKRREQLENAKFFQKCEDERNE